MPLRMWVSNDPSLNAIIEYDYPDYQVPEVVGILSLTWNVKADTLLIKSTKKLDSQAMLTG